jgi:tRNA pseudouridine13 synthase
MSASPPHKRTLDDSTGLGSSPTSKRIKVSDIQSGSDPIAHSPLKESVESSQPPAPESVPQAEGSLLPPSHALLGTTPLQDREDVTMLRIMETDVGISEYIAKGVPQIGGIIKQRCVIISSLHATIKPRGVYILQIH